MPILEPTVLIVGAGASSDFGFPLGFDLRNQVCRALELPETTQLLVDLGHSDSDIVLFRNELRYSGYQSVDRFLEFNQEFLSIGKQAIAACLLPFETEGRLFAPGAPANHWDQRLAATMGIGTGEWTQNKLSVVTFNYDRSLEHYFTRVIAQRRRLAPQAAYEVFAHVPVVHVHGTLGGYPPDAHDGLSYGTEIRSDTVARAADRIQVVSEVDDTLPTFDAAFRHLAKATRIYFLGFGFHPANVRRLRVFNNKPPEGRNVEVAGTNHGYSDLDWKVVESDVLNGHWTGGIYRATAHEFLIHRAAFR